MLWQCGAITSARPPVATTVALPPSSFCMRSTMPSTWAAVPNRIPDWMLSTVFFPMIERGSSSSTRSRRELEAPTDHESELGAGSCALSGDPPVPRELSTLEQSQDGLRVPDVDGEEHASRTSWFRIVHASGPGPRQGQVVDQPGRTQVRGGQ